MKWVCDCSSPGSRGITYYVFPDFLFRSCREGERSSCVQLFLLLLTICGEPQFCVLLQLEVWLS